MYKFEEPKTVTADHVYPWRWTGYRKFLRSTITDIGVQNTWEILREINLLSGYTMDMRPSEIYEKELLLRTEFEEVFVRSFEE